MRAGALGDTLMATPALRALKNQYPDAEIDFLCSAAARPLLEEHPAISKLFTLAQRNVPIWLSSEKRRLIRDLRDRQYDLAVLLESGKAYREIMERVGAKETRDIRATHDASLHSIVDNLRAAGCGCATLEAAPGMELHLDARDEMRAQEMLERVPRPRIGLHAGYGPPRRKTDREQGERLKAWGAENFARLGRILRQRHGAGLVLTGGPDDLPLASKIAAQMSAPPEPPPLILAGRTSVREMAAVIERLDVLVSVDSGPAHMAAALRTPLVVLWGPAILHQVCPQGEASRVRVVRHPVYCAPCYGTSMMKTCRRNICMEAISPARVADEVTALLASRS